MQKIRKNLLTRQKIVRASALDFLTSSKVFLPPPPRRYYGAPGPPNIYRNSYIYIYIYIALYSYIYIYISIYSQIQLYIAIYSYIQLYVAIYSYRYSYIQLYIQLYIVIPPLHHSAPTAPKFFLSERCKEILGPRGDTALARSLAKVGEGRGLWGPREGPCGYLYDIYLAFFLR